MTYYLDGKEIPFATYEELTKQLVSLKKRYLYSKDFAKASLQELFGNEKLAGSKVLEINELSSAWFENKGDFNFVMHHLPERMQLSTVNALVELPSTGDTKDFLMAGNFHENNIEMGYYDASYGNIVRFAKDGSIQVESIDGPQLKGQVRDLARIRIGDKTAYIVGKNNGKAVVIE